MWVKYVEKEARYLITHEKRPYKYRQGVIDITGRSK
jgi:hypothetical protein